MPKPAVIYFRSDDEEPIRVDHADAHDGYVYVQYHGLQEYIPWHRIDCVSREGDS